MGRTKGSKNGVRKVPIRKFRVRFQENLKEKFETVMARKLTGIEVQESTLPVFDSKVLRAYRKQRYGKCIRLVERILINNTDENKDHYKVLQAASLTMLGDNTDQAHLILDEVLDSNPRNSFAMYGKGVAFYFERKIDESIEMFDKAIAANPGEEMERAEDMKMRIDLERRKAVIMVKKMDQQMEDQQVPDDIELPEDLEQMIEDFNVTIDEKFTDLDLLEPEIDETSDDELEATQTQHNQEISCSTHADTTSEVIYEASKVQNGETEENPETADETAAAESKSISGLPSPHIEATPEKVIPDIPETLPKSFSPSTAEEYFAKGMELYMSGSLKKALKSFGKAVMLKPSFTDADEMGTKAQELLELMDVAAMNMAQKNYEVVVEILNEALEVDETNDYVNRPFYFQRGLALFHLGRNEESLKDYASFDRINKIMCEK